MTCHEINETMKAASCQFGSVVPPKEVLFLSELGEKALKAFGISE